MSVRIDTAISNVIHRQVAPYSASLGGDGEKSAQARPLDGVRRVEPVESSEKGRAAGDGRLREGHPEQDRERVLPEGEVEAKLEVAESSYDRRLSYEADVNRVYLEIVNKKDDEVLIRIPSESTAKYLEQITAQSESKDKAESTPSVLKIA